MLVRDAMRPSVDRIHPTATLREAATRMLANGVSNLLVMETDEPLCVVGLRDLFIAPFSARHCGRMTESRSEESLVQVWDRQIVSNILADQVLSLSDEARLMKTAELMVNSGKHPLPVRHDGKIVGTTDREDVMRALLVGKRA